MEPIEVVVRFGRDGTIWPERFIWQGADLQVEGVGRRWEQGGEQHILVMALDGRVFELIFRRESGSWWVRGPGTRTGIA